MTKRNVLTFVTNLIAISIEPIVRLVPRNKRKWAFGAMQSFKDNPKYLFYWTNENHPEIRPIWIAQNKSDVVYLRKQGFEAYHRLSLAGLYHALTSKVYVADHHIGNINRFLAGGAFFVNLWHGSSVKRVRWQAPEKFMRRYHLKNAEEMRTSLFFRIMEYHILFRKIDLCLAPSETQAKEFFAPMMDIPLDKCIAGVYPRNRLLIEGKNAASDFIAKYESIETRRFVEELAGFDKVYIYMPTWRENNHDFMTQAGIDWKLLNDVMEKRNELFVLKFHPFTKLDAGAIGQYSNIRIYPTKSDIYTVLPFIDFLITDYSSIYTDFLTMNKEIMLFVFDYEEYIRGSYDLAEYDKYFVGKKVYDFKQLLSVIESGEDCHVPQKNRDELLEFFWGSHKKNIDLVEEIKKRLQ